MGGEKDGREKREERRWIGERERGREEEEKEGAGSVKTEEGRAV